MNIYLLAARSTEGEGSHARGLYTSLTEARVAALELKRQEKGEYGEEPMFFVQFRTVGGEELVETWVERADGTWEQTFPRKNPPEVLSALP